MRMSCVSAAWPRSARSRSRLPAKWRSWFCSPMEKDYKHVPVLHRPALDALRIRAGGVYIDGTYGRGGHSRGMLERLGEDGRLMLTDRDPQAVADARARFGADGRVTIRQVNFAERSEEHTSELQSRGHLVCRLLLEK